MSRKCCSPNETIQFVSFLPCLKLFMILAAVQPCLSWGSHGNPSTLLPLVEFLHQFRSFKKTYFDRENPEINDRNLEP